LGIRLEEGTSNATRADTRESQEEYIFGVSKSDFARVRFPSSTKARYNALTSKFKNEVVNKCQSEAAYKWLSCIITKVGNKLDAMNVGDSLFESNNVSAAASRSTNINEDLEFQSLRGIPSWQAPIEPRQRGQIRVDELQNHANANVRDLQHSSSAPSGNKPSSTKTQSAIV